MHRRLVPWLALASLPVSLPVFAQEAEFKGFSYDSKDGSSALGFEARVQLLETLTVPDEVGEKTESNLSIPRARVGWKGHVWSKDLEFKLQIDFGKGQAALKDFYADWRFSGDLRLRAGQGKVPFSRQKLTSSSKLAFVDRAPTDGDFDPDRDIGLWLHNGFEKSPELEWAVGVFNGTGEKPRLEGKVQTDPATGEGTITSGKLSNTVSRSMPEIGVRVGYNSGGLKGYTEGDLEGGPLRFGVGLGVVADLDMDGGKDGAMTATVDAQVKVEGLAVEAAFFTKRIQKGDSWTDQTGHANGIHAQVSYAIAETWMPALGYTLVMPDAEGADDESEIAVGLTAMLHGHAIKWANDVAFQDDGTTAPVVARSMIQFSF